MMVRLHSLGILGLRVFPVAIEVDTAPGIHSFKIVGLPDAAVEEARERVNAAVKNSDARPPSRLNQKVVVNLAPADLKKHGPAYDLPIAVGWLAASQQIKSFPWKEYLFVGELSLDGSLREIHGILLAAQFAKKQGKILVLPDANAKETSLVKDAKFIAAPSLRFLMDHFDGIKTLPIRTGEGLATENWAPAYDFDMGFIHGQQHAKRALEIAAAGHHNLLMSGSPGGGKTLLARTLPSILPRLDEAEALEVTAIWSIAGLLSETRPLVTERPFRAPHHTSSAIAIVGGGTYPHPGEVSLAHRGVLFMDEFPEFSRQVLEALRQPMEDGIASVSRATGSVAFPASFMLVAAQNPCPCGHAQDKDIACMCSPGDILRYTKRISGPILDRIDIRVSVPRIPAQELLRPNGEEPSEAVRERVKSARDRQSARFRDKIWQTNGEIPPRAIEKMVPLDTKGKELIEKAIERFYLTPRGYHRVLKVAQTIADLAQSDKVQSEHLAEALQYRIESAEAKMAL